MKAIISRQKAIPRPLVHTPETAEVVVSEDLRGKGVEVNFRRALLEQCQVPRVARFSAFPDFPGKLGHSMVKRSLDSIEASMVLRKGQTCKIFMSEAQQKTIKR